MGGTDTTSAARGEVPWPVPSEVVAAWLRADQRRRRDLYCTLSPEERATGPSGTEALSSDVRGALVCVALVWLIGVSLGAVALVTVPAALALAVLLGVVGRARRLAWRDQPDDPTRTTIEGWVTVKVNGHGVRCQVSGRQRTIAWSAVVGATTRQRTLMLTCDDGHEFVFIAPWNRPSPTLGLVTSVARRVVAAYQAHLAADTDLMARMARGLSRPELLVTAERGLSSADDGQVG